MISIANLQLGLLSFVDGPWWFTSLVKITFLLAVAWSLHFAIAKLNPRWRILLWRSVIVGLVAVIFLDASQFISISLPIGTQDGVPSASHLANDINKPSLETANTNLTVDNPAENLNVANPKLQPPPVFASEDLSLTALPDPVRSKPQSLVSSQANWPVAFAAVWLIGILLVIIREFAGQQGLRRIVRQASANSSLSHQATEIAKELKIAGSTALVSEQISSPLVCRSSFGITLLLPKSIIDSSNANADELAAILTHELSHVASRDLEWNLLIKIVTAVLWPHPFLWRLRKAHVSACEFVADANSARRMNDPSLYVTTLAKVALNASSANRLPGLAMARVSNIRLRLERVMETVNQLPLSRRRIAAALSLGLIGCVSLGAFQMVYASPVDPVTNRSTTLNEKTMVVHITDEQNNPISHHQFETTISTKRLPGGKKGKPELVRDGIYQLSIPDDAIGVSIFATSKSYVRLKANWHSNGEPVELPEKFFFKLAKGAKVSGRVVDEQKNAIPNAKVHLLVGTNQNETPHYFYYDHFVTTDKTGNWSSDQIPADANDIWIRLEHPDFLSDNIYGETVGNVSVEALKAGSHVAEMKKGIVLKGTVLDEFGRPIQGAMIYQGSDRFGSHYPEAKTDMAGEFRFENCRPGQTILTVIAKGFAPDLKTIELTEDADNVAFN